MGWIARLRIRDLEAFSWYDDVEPTFLFLFTSSDVVREPRDPEELDDYPDAYATVLVATAGILADRLDFLGLGKKASERVFGCNLDQWLEWQKALLPEIGEELLQPEIDALEGLELSGWVDLVAEALPAPKLGTARRRGSPVSLDSLLRIWQDDDPRLLLRALVMALDPADDVRLDVSPMREGNHIDAAFNPQAAATAYFSYAMANGSPAVIITEGSTDARILHEALAVRYPHLQSFIRFFDFADGAEGSASSGVRTLKSFAAAGISNRVILLLDNDSAARDARRALKLTLPKHYKIVHYPHLNLAEHYPTLGPAGPASMDVNGLAGSIEMYLGTDVLTGVDGELTPVQWRSYIEGVGAYQGELMHKRQLQQRFHQKVELAMSASSPLPDQDWSGIDAIIETLRLALSEDAPAGG
ncbi:HEPN/Toprim-associated domain-containing protein [Geodermatophilus sabuli]|uniref:Uncharacterized protein n=1 Tax=Geodermatophilus sabuli TaxID=1564158 RepID=A0A285E9E1_9ACTN|nr:HEPN/Toprim-associated domain-containing protein [Geodermatophilus sabuli]MBB3082304.1 hypothetical protein [Geodermatophilus sabuli]SNX94824.1 hypothetical protein SAMN06893097_101621 [Geodermatophilus sabuli]